MSAVYVRKCRQESITLNIVGFLLLLLLLLM